MLETATIKKLQGRNIITDRGERLTMVGNNPTAKPGDTVYTDGQIAYGGQRRLEQIPVVNDSEKVVPIYDNKTGYLTQGGALKVYPFGDGSKGAFASGEVSWSAADGYIDIVQGDSGYNAITAGSCIYCPAVSVSSQTNYVKWIDLMTGDNRPPGVLVGRQIYENTERNVGQEHDEDFWATGNVHDFDTTDHYKFNEDGRHNVSNPRFSLTQEESLIDNPLKVAIGGKVVKKISLRAYLSLADSAYTKIRETVQGYSEAIGDYWAAGAPPNDYIAKRTAKVTDARISADGSFKAILDVSCKGETFVLGTYQADYLTVSKTVRQDFPSINHFTGGGQSAYWSSIRIRTNQEVTRTQKKMSDWGGVIIEAHAVYVLTDSGAEYVRSYATAEPDGDGVPKYDFAITSPGGYANYYELSWEYRHGLLDSPPTVTCSSTGDSYKVHTVEPLSLLYVTVSDSDGADKSLVISLTSGDSYHVTTGGEGGTITDSAGKTVCTLPKLMAMGYTLAGVDAVRIPAGVVICDWRQSAIYLVTIGEKGKYETLKQITGGKNYRLSIMEKYNLKHGTEA